MYWVVMRRMGRSDGSFLTGHMWLIRIGPHGAPDTLKMMSRTPRIIRCHLSATRSGPTNGSERKDGSPELLWQVRAGQVSETPTTAHIPQPRAVGVGVTAERRIRNCKTWTHPKGKRRRTPLAWPWTCGKGCAHAGREAPLQYASQRAAEGEGVGTMPCVLIQGSSCAVNVAL